MSGTFVLDVGRARAAALSDGIGMVDTGTDAVWVTYLDGEWVVEPAGLWTDGALVDRVRDLLTRHS